MSKKDIETLEQEARELREGIWADQEALRKIDHQIQKERAEALGLPKRDGWYLDGQGNIARLEDGIWHDGWGNSGADYDYVVPPMTRLVPKKPKP